MNYATFKASAAILERNCSETAARRARAEADIAAELGIAARGPMNLIAEAIRIHPDYRPAMLAADSAFQALRRFNGRYAKQFSKEIRADIDAKRIAKLFDSVTAEARIAMGDGRGSNIHRPLTESELLQRLKPVHSL